MSSERPCATCGLPTANGLVIGSCTACVAAVQIDFGQPERLSAKELVRLIRLAVREELALRDELRGRDADRR